MLVVFLPELVELGLELFDRRRGRLFGEPAFQGLVEAFDLALCLGMSGRPVLLRHAEEREEMLECIPATHESRGVDGPVVRQRGCWDAVLAGEREKGIDDIVPSDAREGAAVEEVAGVVVEPVQDLDVGAVAQVPVGEVGLPGLVRESGFETDERVLRPFAGFRSDEAGVMQDASNCGG